MKKKGDEPSKCDSCGLGEHWVLLSVRNRGDYLHLCISCVLKLHPGLFCPVCFEVYDGSSSSSSSSVSNDRVKCFKCSSASCHIGCVSGGEDLRSAYVCPSCSNPCSSSAIFYVGKKRNEEKIMDFCSSKIFLAATQIASISMNKAATAAKMESERRVKEAFLSRKRARESIERVVFLANNNNPTTATTEEEEKKSPIPFPTIPTPVAVTEPKKKSKGYSAVTAAVAAQKRIQNQYRAMGNNKMATVGVASSNVLRKNEGLVRLNAPNLSSQRSSTKAVSTKKTGEKLQSPDKPNDKKSSNLAHLLTRVLQEEKDKNGLSSSPNTSRQQHQNPPLNDHDHDHDIEEKEVKKSKPVADSGKKPS